MDKVKPLTITDHCFVANLADQQKDACAYRGCGQPELLHEWTVGAKRANPATKEREMDDALNAIPEPYRSAHLASFRNKEKLLASRWAACFYCRMIYAPRTIKEWIDDGETAMCPVCHVDAVMPLTQEQFDSDFLEQMHHYWFASGAIRKGTRIQ